MEYTEWHTLISPGIFHTTQLFWYSSIFFACMSIDSLFLFNCWGSLLDQGYTTVCLSIHLSDRFWFLSITWLKLLWIFLFVFEWTCFHLYKYPEKWWLNRIVGVCLTFKETPKLPSKSAIVLHSQKKYMRVTVSLNPAQHLVC